MFSFGNAFVLWEKLFFEISICNMDMNATQCFLDLKLLDKGTLYCFITRQQK